MDKKTTTVIVVCWNYGMFLPDAMRSIAEQTRQPEVILIADDHSTDNSYKLSQEYLKNDSKVRYHRNPKRLGTAGNVNEALRLVDTDLVCLLAADDEYAPTYLEKCIRPFEQDTTGKLGVVYTDMQRFGREHGYWKAGEWDAERLKQGNYVNGNSLFSLKAFWDSLNDGLPLQMNGSERYFEDYHIWLRMADKGYFGHYIPEGLMLYRKHDQGHRTDGDDINKRQHFNEYTE